MIVGSVFKVDDGVRVALDVQDLGDYYLIHRDNGDAEPGYSTLFRFPTPGGESRVILSQLPQRLIEEEDCESIQQAREDADWIILREHGLDLSSFEV